MSDLHDTITKIVEKTVSRERGPLDVRSTIDASYAGGAPKTLRPGETVVGSETKKILIPYGSGVFIRASDSVVESDIGNDTVIIGKIGDAPSGVPYSGAYRLLPSEMPSSTAFSTPTQTANQVRVFRFMQPLELKVTSVIFEVVGASGGTNGSVGVYTADGTTKLIDSGAQSLAATGVIAVTLGAAVTLPAAWYCLAWTIDSAIPTFRSVAAPANFNVLNQTTVQKGSAANGSTAGALPSTLGVITSLTFDIILCKLQG